MPRSVQLAPGVPAPAPALQPLQVPSRGTTSTTTSTTTSGWYDQSYVRRHRSCVFQGPGPASSTEVAPPAPDPGPAAAQVPTRGTTTTGGGYLLAAAARIYARNIGVRSKLRSSPPPPSSKTSGATTTTSTSTSTPATRGTNQRYQQPSTAAPAGRISSAGANIPVCVASSDPVHLSSGRTPAVPPQAPTTEAAPGPAVAQVPTSNTTSVWNYLPPAAACIYDQNIAVRSTLRSSLAPFRTKPSRASSSSGRQFNPAGATEAALHHHYPHHQHRQRRVFECTISRCALAPIVRSKFHVRSSSSTSRTSTSTPGTGNAYQGYKHHY